MDVSLLSSRYQVRYLNPADISEILALCGRNSLYYHYCPPVPTRQAILDDMRALPPNREAADKYYVGYFDGGKLIAVADLILGYPDEETAFIGFFMTAEEVQNRGVGSAVIEELCSRLADSGFSYVRLAWARGNPQAEHFWKKNGFSETGITSDTKNRTVVSAQRIL